MLIGEKLACGVQILTVITTVFEVLLWLAIEFVSPGMKNVKIAL